MSTFTTGKRGLRVKCNMWQSQTELNIHQVGVSLLWGQLIYQQQDSMLFFLHSWKICILRKLFITAWQVHFPKIQSAMITNPSPPTDWLHGNTLVQCREVCQLKARYSCRLSFHPMLNKAEWDYGVVTRRLKGFNTPHDLSHTHTPWAPWHAPHTHAPCQPDTVATLQFFFPTTPERIRFAQIISNFLNL